MKKNIKIQRFTKIQDILRVHYPDVKTQLDHKNPFELLIATILSAQCTDNQVNKVTPELFKTLPTPDAFINAPLAQIEKLIHSTGFYRNKAKHIKNCAQAVKLKFNGQVPKTMDELVTLPGVGRKTANVILSAAFGIPGIPVDTHVNRISNRLKFTKSKNPDKIEVDLMAIVPQNEWSDFSLRLIYFGREVCRAKKPVCHTCPMNTLCDAKDKVA